MLAHLDPPVNERFARQDSAKRRAHDRRNRSRTAVRSELVRVRMVRCLSFRRADVAEGLQELLPVL